MIAALVTAGAGLLAVVALVAYLAHAAIGATDRAREAGARLRVGFEAMQQRYEVVGLGDRDVVTARLFVIGGDKARMARTLEEAVRAVI